MKSGLFTVDQLKNNPLLFKQDELIIPVDLLIFTLKYKKVNQVKLYIALKSLFNGQFKEDGKSIQLICETLGYKCTKTFYSNFNWLIRNKWIIFRKKYCIIKSFAKIRFKTQSFSKRGVIFTPSNDLKSFRPFVYGAVITYSMKLKRAWERYSGTIKGSPYKKYHPRSSSFNLPVTYLMKILNLSKGTASNYKNIAANAGYLSVEKVYTPLNVSGAILSNYKRYADDKQLKKLRVRKGKLFHQESDKITSDMIVKRKRSLRNT